MALYLSVYQILRGDQISGGAMTNRWTVADVPDQSGRIAVVTGASSGLGLETARVLVARGATVVLACRDTEKARRAAGQIQAEANRATGPMRAEANRTAWPMRAEANGTAAQIRGEGGRATGHIGAGAGRASVRVVHLDLASLASVRRAAEEIRDTCARLDLLINNAGVMAVPYHRTEDGLELTLATNHLGPFALTGLLLDRLLDTPRSRVVTVSSIGHRMGTGTMHFDDLQSERDYQPWPAYYQSKLANLLFSYELQSRLAAAGVGTIALAAHPGNARTELWRHIPRLTRTLYRPGLSTFTFWFAQSAPAGALATLRAATDPAARGGEYYGPPGRLQYTGHPVRVESSAQSHDMAAARRLWEVSERLTGVRYEVLARSG
jgi:NAD(P)-dependent dehydrogenase (short-subunit alcohol dehydrogenase family)